MANKPFRALVSMLTLTVILTVLYAGDKRKPPPISRIDTAAFSMTAGNLRTSDLVYRINHDQQYTNLSPSEKIKVITRALRQDKESRGIHRVHPKPTHKVNARSGKRRVQAR